MDVLEIESSSKRHKCGKTEIKGLSMTELFTPEEIRDHIASLIPQSPITQKKSQSGISCQLCGVDKLSFNPPTKYCSRCAGSIPRDAVYYTSGKSGMGGTEFCYCLRSYNCLPDDADAIIVNATFERKEIRKCDLTMKKNDDKRTAEKWIQCDKCEAWQHQICALYNGRLSNAEKAEYTCPICCAEEIKKGERIPLPQSAILGAKDLPRNMLSDHIEQRLFRRLTYERQERARVQGKCVDQIPGVEGIVVRVVSSVDRNLKVNPHIADIFREENYPNEMLFKSKAILLFQKIDGVEVCLFGMFVQEFGSECQPINQRRVNISYFDSVKYFRPEVKTVSGEALRTFVYHEILIGYLEYCKKRGFTSCYIWVSPRCKDEDDILYRHPKTQYTPTSYKLREWHLAMLKKASTENIVVEVTNLYDHFFVSTGECKAKVTVARLPYFEGDYWPGAAGELMQKCVTGAGKSDLSSNSSKDKFLMDKLGDEIMPMKDDLIMVHFHYSCTYCCKLMISGNQWVCQQCKKFQICDECYEAEQKLDEEERHIKGTHTFYSIEITGVPGDTKDKDEIIESEFFITRQAFRCLSTENYFQFDTIRRAKHSSMMVLYHLHNPMTPLILVRTVECQICHHNNIVNGECWRCEICTGYDECYACHNQKKGDHPHKLTDVPYFADLDAQNIEARHQRVLQLRELLDLMVHTSKCRASQWCKTQYCIKMKKAFGHRRYCKGSPSGKCSLCKSLWDLGLLHGRQCQGCENHVYLCSVVSVHLRRLQSNFDMRQRIVTRNMMRVQAAEVPGSSG